MSVKTDLREELTNEIVELSRVQFGSDEYKTGVNGVTQMADRVIEMERIELEKERIRIEQEKLEAEYQKNEDERQDRKAKNRIAVAGITIPSAITVLGAIAMFVYEERGSIVSQAGRKIVDRIFRAK